LLACRIGAPRTGGGTNSAGKICGRWHAGSFGCSWCADSLQSEHHVMRRDFGLQQRRASRMWARPGAMMDACVVSRARFEASLALGLLVPAGHAERQLTRRGSSFALTRLQRSKLQSAGRRAVACRTPLPCSGRAAACPSCLCMAEKHVSASTLGGG
jgi:hypothetical protein